MYLIENHICVLVGKHVNEKYVRSFSLILVKLGCYELSHSRSGPGNSYRFLSYTSVDAVFEIPDLEIEVVSSA
jgi:hypothetical protein